MPDLVFVSLKKPIQGPIKKGFGLSTLGDSYSILRYTEG